MSRDGVILRGKFMIVFFASLLLLAGCQSIQETARNMDQKLRQLVDGESAEGSAQEGGGHYEKAMQALKTEDYQLAHEHLQLAAAENDSRAIHSLGNLYSLGKGVPAEPVRAVQYWQRAAELGHAHSAFMTAKAYANGQGVVKDALWAARWYGTAATQGHIKAQFNYAIYWASGIGLPKDPQQGYYWLRVAGENADPRAGAVRQKLEQGLSPEEVEVQERRAEAFQASKVGSFPDRPAVLYMQMRLTELGFDPGPIDGDYGPRTASALKAFLARERKSFKGQPEEAHLRALKAG